MIHELFEAIARRYPQRTAVIQPDCGAVSYVELFDLSNRVRDRLAHAGVKRGDRVAVCLDKSIDSVATILGILKVGAAYVPLDPTAPKSRNAYIVNDCQVRAIIRQVKHEWQSEQQDEILSLIISLDEVGDGSGMSNELTRLDSLHPAPTVDTAKCSGEDLAYILYTSGSTGTPKGVQLTHENAVSFVDWCQQTLSPSTEDRFSSHAPFHFDLSILDLFVPLTCGASLVLVSHEVGKQPHRLAKLISKQRITVWYSTPTILSLLAQHGALPTHDLSALRLILFAGEVFPIKFLRLLKQQLTKPRYFNLYGPTETNVCTAYEIPSTIPDDRTDPYPIGRVCCHLLGQVVDVHGKEVAPGDVGELWIAGAGVTRGYWNLPDQTESVFVTDHDGVRWYRTGDLVLDLGEGCLDFRGRRDRMIKRRGFRIELGEIEACLYQHPEVRQVAVLATTDLAEPLQVKAFVSTQQGNRLSLIEMKKFCSQRLPIYMVPDCFVFEEFLPTTPTDKIDYLRLAAH